MLKQTVITAGAMLFFTMAYAAEEVKQFTVPLMNKAPVIDGNFNAEEWKGATSFGAMHVFNTGKLEERNAKAYIGADEQNIYFAIISELPQDGEIKTKEQTKCASVAMDDAVEVFISPEPDNPQNVFYQYLSNSAGVDYYDAHPRAGGKAVAGWKNKFEVKHGRSGGFWVAEGRIPVSAIAPGRKITDGVWSLSLCRDWKEPFLFSCAPGKFNGEDVRIKFESGIPAVQYSFIDDPFLKSVKTALKIANTGSKEAKINVFIETKFDNMPEFRLSKSETLPGGGMLDIPYVVPYGKECNKFDMTVRVTADGKQIYNQKYSWQTPRRNSLWTIVKEKILPFDFEFAVYPYKKLLLINPLLKNYNGKLPDSVSFTIAEKATGKVIKTYNISTAVKKCSNLELPDNLNGTYKLTMEVNGDKLTKTFERKLYDWENNQLGKTRKVYSPFEEIKFNNNTVSVVYRDYLLGGNGLPEQIKIKGISVLAAPVTLKLNGKDCSGNLTITESAVDRVVTRSSINGLGNATARWEYDGILKYDLTLQPGTIDSLILEIPLKDQYAPMIHAMGVMRNPVVMNLPRGNGVIWNAAQAEQGQMPAGFSPYVFVGSAHRGVAFFAENDKNWSWDRKTPNVELIRSGEVLTMRVNLVNKPVTLTRPQTLSFGLLAAPIKPRLESWRSLWRDEKLEMLSTCINWLGGPGNCTNVYPPNRDEWFWKMLEKNYTFNGPRVTEAERKEAIRRGVEAIRKIEPDNIERVKWWEIVAETRLNQNRDIKMLFYYNRAVFNALDEYRTFMNEWVLENFLSRELPLSTDEIKIVPSESYNDFAIYWYARSFKYKNQGVYWDNYFICPSYNREMTDAYADINGNVTPAAGIWQLRELPMRTFKMMCEKDMRPLTFPHMTSVSILPMLSHATIQLDWEMNYSGGPVQTRFSRAYCQLISNGELAGALPLMLNDTGNQTGDEFIQRSFLGVCLVHELDSNLFWAQQASQTLHLPIREKYFKNNKLKVVRYWDEGELAAQCSNKDFAWIVYYLSGERAVLVAVSYLDKEAECKFSINLDSLGLSGSTVKNFENGANIRSDNGQFIVKLPAYGVAAFEMEKK